MQGGEGGGSGSPVQTTIGWSGNGGDGALTWQQKSRGEQRGNGKERRLGVAAT
jgi:hypothetical protein